MLHYIENEFLRIGVSERGAELQSLYSKESDFEYLWQGDKAVWSGRSPILFPIVGRLKNDRYFLDGEEYFLQKHGFAREMNWEFVPSEDNTLTFRLTQTEETLKKYPFNFSLSVTYSLNEKTLSVSHTVLNTDEKMLCFSLGAHPGFNCAIGDVLEFECDEYAHTEKIDLETALRLPQKQLVLDNQREITITRDIFNEDALILSSLKSSFVTLKSPSHDRTVKVTFGGAPYLGIWAKPGAPYVCIEPWYGVNDGQEEVSDFIHKDEIQLLTSGDSFNFTWTATVSE